ncbi:MAG: DUF2071 domain-containing protein [Bacteroidota bacterium]
MKIPDDGISFQHRLHIRETPPAQPLVMYQRWRDLLFLHWEVEPDQIQQTLPSGLRVDTFEGKAYVGIVPFFMEGIRPRFLPAVPGISNFLELNLRTYVIGPDGTPGVWFYSLDANSWIGVEVAKSFFSLPYEHAYQQSPFFQGKEWIDFHSTRKNPQEAIPLRYTYRPVKEIGEAPLGTLEFFLVERYILFSYRPKSQKLFKGRIHHTPYVLQEAEVHTYQPELFALNGFETPQRSPDHVVMSKGVSVNVHWIEEVKRA